jgi:tRNA threonylcarbamoyl adenosine modification protein YeaZ
MTSPSTSLAIDTALGLSLALKTNAKTYTYSTSTSRSSDLLPTELASLFAKSATTASQLTHILATTGPGSFTGIRLGLAAAEALKLVNPTIIITGLSTLHALALQVVAENAPTGNFTLALDAAGGQAYTQTFTSSGQPTSPAECLPLPEIAPKPNLYAAPTLLLEAHPLATLNPEILFKLAEDPRNHLPAQPVYLKPLTYKTVQ